MTISDSHSICSTDEQLPNITCPHSEVKYVDSGDTPAVETVPVMNATAKGDKHIETNTVTPSTYTLSKDNIYKVINLKQEATDNQGFKAVCSYQYIFKRECYAK